MTRLEIARIKREQAPKVGEWTCKRWKRKEHGIRYEWQIKNQKKGVK